MYLYYGIMSSNIRISESKSLLGIQNHMPETNAKMDINVHHLHDDKMIIDWEATTECGIQFKTMRKCNRWGFTHSGECTPGMRPVLGLEVQSGWALDSSVTCARGSGVIRAAIFVGSLGGPVWGICSQEHCCRWILPLPLSLDPEWKNFESDCSPATACHKTTGVNWQTQQVLYSQCDAFSTSLTGKTEHCTHTRYTRYKMCGVTSSQVFLRTC